MSERRFWPLRSMHHPCWSGEQLGVSMPNEVAWRLGDVCNQAMKGSAGDHIDRGLILARLLAENGFVLTLNLNGEPLPPPPSED